MSIFRVIAWKQRKEDDINALVCVFPEGYENRGRKCGFLGYLLIILLKALSYYRDVLGQSRVEKDDFGILTLYCVEIPRRFIAFDSFV